MTYKKGDKLNRQIKYNLPKIKIRETGNPIKKANLIV
jgi:hypothetical protein